MKKIIFEKKNSPISRKEGLEKDITISEQITMINQVYLEEKFEESDRILREIKKKISGYKQQDIHKSLFDRDLFITVSQIIEKLVTAKLRCYYCRGVTHIFYKHIREPTQWTLDRIDNNKGHNNNNILIACLKCNLGRRCTNKDAYLFTKQLQIKKLEI